MIISYKYRAYPQSDVEDKLNQSLDNCRWVYNKILETSRNAYKSGIKLSKYETQAMIPVWKQDNPHLSTAYSKTLQMVNNTYWANVKALAEAKKRGRKIGRLRFKGAYRYRTLNYDLNRQKAHDFSRGMNAVRRNKIHNYLWYTPNI